MTDPSDVYGSPRSKSQRLYADNTLLEGNNVIQSQRFRVTLAQVNAGRSILSAVVGLKYRVVDWTMVAYGGAAAGATAVTLLSTQSSSGVALATVAVGALTQSAIVKPETSSVTVLASGASNVANDANTAITVGKTGSSFATATGVDVIVDYTLEE